MHAAINSEQVPPAHKKQICYAQPLAIMGPHAEPGHLSLGNAEASPWAPSCADKQFLEGGQSLVSPPSTVTHLRSVKTEAIGSMKPWLLHFLHQGHES